MAQNIKYDQEYNQNISIEIAILKDDLELPGAEEEGGPNFPITDPAEEPLTLGTLVKKWGIEKLDGGDGGTGTTIPGTNEMSSPSNEYRLAEHYYKNMIANFYIPVLMPLIDGEEDSMELEMQAPSTRGIMNDGLLTSDYIEQNYVQLVIPKYIVMNFKYRIPKGTKFLVAFVGGKATIYNASIIGLYGPGIGMEEVEVEEE